MTDRIKALENALRGIVDAYEASSELHTSSADCAANLYDRARAALAVSQPAPITQIISEAPVQVCPICDIEGCRHIREAASQPAPTAYRAVPTFISGRASDTAPVGQPLALKVDAAEKQRRNAITSHELQMADAQKQCVPCRLCGGAAVISDAGPGWGYYIHCEASVDRMGKARASCLQSGTRISGWAYNASDMWNALNAPQPVTAQDAARVPEIAALIEKSEALRDDVTGRVDAFGDRIGIAQPMIGFGAKQWADFIAALRAIAEGRA